jgi:tRNA/rRNA methyltransferase
MLTAASLPGSGLILVRPKYPENIGAAARIACNFGIEHLTVVTDEPPDAEKMLKMATHKASHLIEQLRLTSTTSEAAAPYHFLVGTTARQGKGRTLLEQTPHEVMSEVAPLAAGHRIALMFGPESSGLSNDDLDLCQFFSTIPTADFSSLNLAQAVAIYCYELHMAAGRISLLRSAESCYANSQELEGMYGHIEQALGRIGFLHETNRAWWMRAVRRFLGRTRLKKKEASLIRGVCRKFLWHSGA